MPTLCIHIVKFLLQVVLLEIVYFFFALVLHYFGEAQKHLIIFTNEELTEYILLFLCLLRLYTLSVENQTLDSQK